MNLAVNDFEPPPQPLFALCVLKILPTRLFGVSSKRERSLRCLPPDVSVVKTAHTRQADDFCGVPRSPRIDQRRSHDFGVPVHPNSLKALAEHGPLLALLTQRCS